MREIAQSVPQFGDLKHVTHETGSYDPILLHVWSHVTLLGISQSLNASSVKLTTCRMSEIILSP